MGTPTDFTISLGNTSGPTDFFSRFFAIFFNKFSVNDKVFTRIG